MNILKSVLNFFFEPSKTSENKNIEDGGDISQHRTTETMEDLESLFETNTHSNTIGSKEENIKDSCHQTERKPFSTTENTNADHSHKEQVRVSSSLFNEQQITSKEKPNERTLFSSDKRKQTIYIWVGIDFGTSSTKVAYKVLGTAGREVKPLCLSPKPFEEFEIPSVAAFDQNGDLVLGVEAERELKKSLWKNGIRYFKVLLAGKYDALFRDESISRDFTEYISKNNKRSLNCSPDNISAVYLAYVMKRSRIELQNIFSHMNLELNFNVCIPIDTYENKAVHGAFQKVITVSEMLEEQWTNQQTASDILVWADNIWKSMDHLNANLSHVHLVPEAVAQTASYITSLGSKPGIHAVIDFGAGTTDFSIFNLEKATGRAHETYWYSARNFPGGMYQIEYAIGNYYLNKGRNLTHTGVIDCLAKFDQQDKTLKKDIEEILKTTWEKARWDVWGKAYGKCSYDREWQQDKVKVLICGGGSSIPLIKNIFCNSWCNQSWGPYQVDFLKKPNDFNGSNAAFRRLSVSYGLSYPRKELGKYTLPEDCPDQTPYIPRMPNIFDEQGDPVYANNH